MAVLTLLDIAKMNGVVGDLVDEAARAVPEMTGRDTFNGGRTIPGVGASRTLKGLFYKTLIRTALPSVAFRSANQGTAQTKSVYENRMVECFTANPRWSCDVAVADRSEDGVAVLMSREASAHLQAALQHCAKQFYYGTGNDAKGFPGLVTMHNTDLVVDAGGTTADTGSSLWAVKYGADYTQWVYGNSGKFRVTDMEIRDVDDADGNPYSAYFQEMFAHVGLQMLNKFSVGRIKKLTAEASKTLTDDMIAQLIEKFPVGYKPDVMFCSRRSLRQLQDSRTATNSTGAPAPFPQEAFGIPIVATDSILDTEALTL